MTICDDLRQSVLQAAIQGKLTQQLPEDGTAADLLVSIKAEKEQLIKEKKIKKEKPLAPISEDEIPFDIPENWLWVKLGEISKKITDGTHSTPKYTSEGIPFLSVKDMSDGKINFDHTKFISATEHRELYKRCNPEFGDLLITKVGTTGIPAIVDTQLEFSLFVSVALIKSNWNYIDVAFLRYAILTPLVQEQVSINTRGVGNKNWVIDAIINTFFPLPPLAEQHRIVARVDELMAKIDELETVEKELVALKKAFPSDMKASLLQAAMQGKLTQQLPEDGSATDLLASIKAEKDKLIAEKKIKKDSIEVLEDVPFDIPASWCRVRLNDIVVKTVKRGKSPTYTTKSNTLVFAQKCNTKAGYINMELALFLDEGKLNKYPDDEFMQDMDIVINSTGNGTLGRVGFFRNTDNPRELRIVPDSHVTVIRPSSQMNAAYAMYCMKYYQPYFEKTCTGSTNQTELSVDTLKNLAFPLPPLAEQKRIVEKLDKLLPLCDALKEDGMA